MSYIGRFAPSPTGPLHFGSLVAAAGSYLHARAAGGQWLLRIEDVDTERNVPGAEAEILRALVAYGFAWDGAVLRQTTRLDAYAAALEALRRAGRVFGCACSRSEIERAALAARLPRAVDGGLVYPGTCRAGLPAGCVARAWRLRVPDPGADQIAFDDALQGRRVQHLASAVGDFVLKRADGPYAYQLAVVVDDAFQGVTDVVRGADLIDSTPRQIWLQRCLGVPTPRYLHLPVALDAAGQKLSKQTRAAPLDLGQVGPTLWAAFAFLGLRLPAELRQAPPPELWSAALAATRAHGFTG
ncbi:MAG TPA: tRNA glutamyl-Q(34) synthetase GluQRS [Rhodocyclaceae bacterium]|nr:tRNA glutamyl-Q(34) synthetase GluQRS [Rhodocyclaceae bacterium]